MSKLDPEKIDVAFSATMFREELDALLHRHQAVVQLGWDGKWAKFQVCFPNLSKTTVVTLVETAKGKHTRYVMHPQEVREFGTPSPISVAGRDKAKATLDLMLVQAAFGKIDTDAWLTQVIDAAFETKIIPKKEEK